MAKIGGAIVLPEKTKPLEISLETATLVNITDVKLPIKMFTYGSYTLPFCVAGFRTMRDADGTVTRWPCEPGQEWAAAKIRGARGTIDYGEKQRNEFEIKAADIVLDICRQTNGDIWGIGHDTTGEIGDETARGFAGLFLADGDEPTDEEIADMHELLRMSDEALIQEGHKTWDQFGKPEYIHAGFKRAAIRAGVDAKWLYTVTDTRNIPDCPHCGSKLAAAHATVCATCHRDVVPVNASERPQEASPKPPARRGRPHKEAAA